MLHKFFCLFKKCVDFQQSKYKHRPYLELYRRFVMIQHKKWLKFEEMVSKLGIGICFI